MTANSESIVLSADPESQRRNLDSPASNKCGERPRGEPRGSLTQLIRSCQCGNRDAQRELYEACQPRIYRLAIRMVGPKDAADITQQVFLQALRTIGQFHGNSRFETWLYRLAVNEVLQHLRHNRHKFQSLDWDPVDESLPLDNGEALELLEHALAKIEPELRSIFLLREIERLSYREIAEVHQIPEGTVGSRLNRARNELRNRLSELGYEPT